MRNAETLVIAAAVVVAGLASPALAARRVVVIDTGAHAAAMNRIFRANQRHDAVIDSVQRNINGNLRRN